MFIRRKNRKGQAAVEAMYCIPVMLLVYLIGAQLWSITWNAQYVHVKARRDAMDKAAHRPCWDNDGNGIAQGDPIDEVAWARTKGKNAYRHYTNSGNQQPRYLPTARDHKMEARYRIICQSP